MSELKTRPGVLHLLPHAGGGVGSVLRALLSEERRSGSQYIHSIVSLERLNPTTQQFCNRAGIEWIDEVGSKGKQDELAKHIARADIVLVHWWNHPLLVKLLYDGLGPSRIVLWSHVNGFSPPQCFFPELLIFPDRIVFASKASLSAPFVQQLPAEQLEQTRVIRSCVGMPEEARFLCSKEPPVQSGYVGTVESVKMHPDFLRLCAPAGINTPFIVAGGPDHERLKIKAAAMGLLGRFEILGPVSDPKPIFRKLHIFPYPLTHWHYGTGEQVLIEAMAFGAVPVVMANPTEMAIVRHGETGIIATSADEFVSAIHSLMNNSEERCRMAAIGHEFVRNECGIELSTKAFHDVFEGTLGVSKRPHSLRLPEIPGLRAGSAFHLFLSAAGYSTGSGLFKELTAGEDLNALPPAFMARTRGSPFHYLDMLGLDDGLNQLCGRINEHKGSEL